ncbi:nog2, partial [Moniliophthora roreri]
HRYHCGSIDTPKAFFICCTCTSVGSLFTTSCVGPQVLQLPTHRCNQLVRVGQVTLPSELLEVVVR